MNKTVKSVISGILIGVTVVGIFFLGYFFNYLTMDGELKDVYQFLQTYKKHYLYDEDGNLVKDISNAILDEYSQYYTKEEYEKYTQTSYGNMCGIGLSFYGNNLTIYGVSGNSPCKLAGVKSGGVVTHIDVGNGYEELSSYNEFSTKYATVKKDASVGLKINYNGEEKTYVVTKREYKQTFVEYADNLGVYTFTDTSGEMSLQKTEESTFIQDEKTGYIAYDSFYGKDKGITGSVGQIEEVLKKFKQDKKSKIIIDLRNNTGGYIDILCDIAKHFIDGDKSKNNLVLYSEYKDGKKKSYYTKPSVYHEYGFEKIVVLANQNTASASESFIGALLDYDKTNKVTVLVASSTLKGETVYKTYGKGIMQTTYKHLDGSAVKLTVAETHWPISNTCIHKVGIIGKQEGKVLAVNANEILQKALSI